MSPHVAARRTRALARMAVALVIVMAIAVGVLVFAAFGWQRMDSVCTTDAAVPPGASGESASFSWSWSPLGFTCTWPALDSGDVSVTKLWW